MHVSTLTAALLATLSTGLYFVGMAFFKEAGGRMPTLRGTHMVHATFRILMAPLWWAGASLLAAGLCIQYVAMGSLSLSEGYPAFLAGLSVLVVVAVPVMGERLRPSEWCCLLLTAGATVMLAFAARPGGGTAPAPTSLLLAVAVPSILLPFATFVLWDRRAEGIHARPLTGVAYGLSAGIVTGMAELSILGLTRVPHPTPLSLLENPNTAVLAVSGVIALGQLQMALQRCRLLTVALIATITAKTHLVLCGSLLYGLPVPSESGPRALLAGGFLLTLLALAILPRHDRTHRPPAHRHHALPESFARTRA